MSDFIFARRPDPDERYLPNGLPLWEQVTEQAVHNPAYAQHYLIRVRGYGALFPALNAAKLFYASLCRLPMNQSHKPTLAWDPIAGEWYLRTPQVYPERERRLLSFAAGHLNHINRKGRLYA